MVIIILTNDIGMKTMQACGYGDVTAQRVHGTGAWTGRTLILDEALVPRLEFMTSKAINTIENKCFETHQRRQD